MRKLTTNNNYCHEIDDKNFIRDNYIAMTPKQIGEILGKSSHSVTEMRRRMGLPSRRDVFNRVVTKEFLVARIFVKSNDEIAKEVGCKKSYIAEKIKLFGLSKKGRRKRIAQTNCKHCGVELKIPKHRYKNSGNFCNLRCFGKHKTLNAVGAPMVDVVCGECGTVFSKREAIIRATQNCKHFCSDICRYKNHSRNISKHNPFVYSKQRVYIKQDGVEINMRSTYEVAFAEWLTSNEYEWEYEPKSFELYNSHYCPDFFVKNWGVWVKVKGWFRDDAKREIKEFRELYPEELLIVATQDVLKMYGIQFNNRGRAITKSEGMN